MRSPTLGGRTLVMVVALVSFVVTACAGMGAAGDDTASQAQGEWTLTDGTDVEGPLPDLAEFPGTEVTLRIDEREWGGRAACNSYGGQVTIGGDGRVDVGEGFFATEMACEPSEIMELERRYLGALMQVDTVEVDRAPDEADVVASLTLTGPDVRLRFVEQPPEQPAALVDTRWVLDGMSSGGEPDDAVSSPPISSRAIDLVLHGNGTFDAQGFCDGFAGTWEHDRNDADEPTLLLDLRERVAEDCPDEWAVEEEHLTEVLFSDATTMRIDGPVLALRAPNGTGLMYRAAEPRVEPAG